MTTKAHAPLRTSKSQSKLNIYFLRHVQACLVSLGQITQTPLTSIMILIVIAIALALPASLFMLLHNTQQLSKTWQDSSQISLYLKKDTSSDRVQQLLQQLQTRPNVANASYISPEQGLAEFQRNSQFSDILNTLKTNPLPGVIVVTPSATATPATLQQLTTYVQNLPEVDQAQMDMTWVKRLHEILIVGKRIVLVLGCLLAVGVLLIIGSVIHLETQSHKQEIQVFKLVGATNAFIRRPFLYTGILYGLFGSIIAWFIAMSMLWSLSTPVKNLTQLYGSQFQLHGFGLGYSMLLLFIGILLGLIGAWLAVNRHLSSV
jgi:cell division transport system permease protein